MLAEFRDWIKTKIDADHYSIGLIDSTKDKSVGIYGDGYQRRVEAIGKANSYDVAGIRILVHWTKNLAETEAVARNLYDAIRYTTDTDMGTIHAQYFDLNYSEAVFLGTDVNGVYEYMISGTLYYRKR